MLAGCERSPAGAPYDCTCDILTDTDVPILFTVAVCTAREAEAVGAAESCARSTGPGHVERCRCEARAPAASGACRVGACGGF